MNNDLPGIHEEDLAGYQKDKRLREGLGGVYHFLPAFFVILFGTFLSLTFLEKIGFWTGYAGAAVAFFCCLITLLKRRSIRPVSPYTGKPLQRFKNLSAPPGYSEIIYVDRDTEKYWVETFGTPPST